MPSIKRFEDIRAWQAARELTNFVYKMTKNDLFLNDWGLRNQIRRAAGSSMHNIAEGFDAGSDSEFVRFLGYARRSVSEVQSQLYTALDQKYIDKKVFKKVYDKADQTIRQINGFISYLMKNKSSKKIKDLSEVYTIETDQSD